jgi:hypothetical protein
MPDIMSTFTLTIALGNDAMQTAEDVASALRATADYIEGTGGWGHIDAGSVRDLNGNPVGEWEVA